jgi:ankyrin repeat protein
MNWLTGGSGFYAVTGKPGSGKSVLMNAVATRVIRNSSATIVLRHFFNNRGQPLAYSFEGFLRSALIQAISQDPSLFDYMAEEGQFMTYLYGQGDDSLIPNSNEIECPPQWSISLLRQSLKAVLSQGSRQGPILLIIDALDECNVKHGVSYLIRFLGEIMSASTSTNLRVCFSCRDLTGIVVPGLFGQVTMQNENEQDITSFVNNQWQPELGTGDSTKKMVELKTELIRKADGIFLWARLALERVQESIRDGATVGELWSTVSDIPSELSGVFSMLLGQIDERYMKESRMMLAIVLTAHRPFSLREFRMVMAMAQCETFKSKTDLETSEKFIREDAVMMRRIRSRCGGLLEVKANPDSWLQSNTRISVDSEKIQFIHQSVKDFLSAQSKDPTSRIPSQETLLAEGHALLAKACLRYACVHEMGDFERQWEMRGKSSMLEEFPFIKYALSNVWHHCREAEELGVLQGAVVQSIVGAETERIETMFRVYRCLWMDRAQIPDTSLLYVGVECKLASLVEICCENGATRSPDWQRDGGNTYLMAAIDNGDRKTVKTLLKHGVSCNGRDEKFMSPLAKACKRGEPEIVRMLLDAGADINDDMPVVRRRATRDSILFSAAYSINCEVIRVLIEHEPAIISERWQRDAALAGLARGASVHFYSMSDDHLEIKEKMSNIFKIISACEIEIQLGAFGADMAALIWMSTGFSESALHLFAENSSDLSSLPFQQTFLGVACVCGFLSSVRFLNESNPGLALIPSRVRYLTMAIHNPDIAVMRYLLDIGLDSNIQGKMGDTLLHDVAQFGSQAHIDLLLGYGADPSVCNVLGCTPFHYALQNSGLRHSKGVLLRLRAQEYVNLPTRDGVRPLHLAAASGWLPTIEWLLSLGAELNGRDDNSRTALHTASSSMSPDSTQVLKFLIDRGLSVHERDGVGMTPLHHALYSYDSLHDDEYDRDVLLANLKILLRYGADVNAQDYEGNTPMHFAVWRGHLGSVNMLLREGADISIPDKNGRCPVELARFENIRDILELDLSRTRDY